MTDAPDPFPVPVLPPRRPCRLRCRWAGLGPRRHRPPAAAQEGTPEIETTRAVPYGTVDPDAQVLDVVRPIGPADPRPAVVLVHGGGLVPGPGRYELSGAAEGLAGPATSPSTSTTGSSTGGTGPIPGRPSSTTRSGPCAGSAPTPRPTGSTPSGSAPSAGPPAGSSPPSSASATPATTAIRRSPASPAGWAAWSTWPGRWT